MATRAKKVASKVSNQIEEIEENIEESKIVQKAKELYDNPAVRYIVGGVALTAFGKFMNNFSTKYPEISNLVKDGLDQFEGKLIEFKNLSQNKDQTDELQH